MPSRSEAREIGRRTILGPADDLFDSVDGLTFEDDRRRFPGHRQRFWILYSRLILERLGIDATPPLDDMQCVGGQPDARARIRRLVLRTRQPSFAVEGNHVD